MKRLNLLIICLLCFILPINFVSGQTLEAEKTHELSKDAKKGYLASFKYDENAKVYTLVFVREKNKKTIYVTYKYDYDFNKTEELEEELTDLEASKKFDFVDFTEEPWKAPTVLRVDGDGWNMNQVALKKGRIERRWIPASYTTVGNYTWYVPGYYKFDFEVEEKFKPKIEVELELDPRTPKAVVNMAKKAAEKIKMVAYLSDEPNFEVNTSRMYADLVGRNQGTMSHLGKSKSYQGASGDIMLLGYQEWYIQKDVFRRFVALNIGVDNLSVKNQSLIEFEYMYMPIMTKNMPDNTMIAIFAPAGFYKNPGPNPNTRAFEFVRIDKQANVIERFSFESPSSYWKINDIVMYGEDIYLYGQASMEKNDKHYDKCGVVTKFDNFQLMKVKGGKMEYITSTNMGEFASKLQLPPDVKKVGSYEGKDFEVGPITITSTGDLFISGQEKDGATYGNINLFQFGPDGKLRAQYGYKLKETSKEATSQTTQHVEFENQNGKSLTWIVFEMNGTTEDKLLLYPRVATIDLEKAAVSAFQAYGYNKDQAFYVDNNNPIILIDNISKAVFFGADKKDKVIWFSRVKLSQ